MSVFGRNELIEPSPSFTDLFQTKEYSLGLGSELYLQSLRDRVSALELSMTRKYTWTTEIKSSYENLVDQKYKWEAVVNDGNKDSDENNQNYKFISQVKGKGDNSPIIRTYMFQAYSGHSSESSHKSEKKVTTKKKIKKSQSTGPIEITDSATNHRLVVLRQKELSPQYAAALIQMSFRAYLIRRSQASSKGGENTRGKQREISPQDAATLIQMSFREYLIRRSQVTGEKTRGKQKEISPQDAAILIQRSFRAYLIRRSQVIRALRDLGIAKTKLKEIRTLFNNFTYRHRVARDAEERQRFTEKIMVLLLTVDAIEGADLMVRAVKKSMVNELEAMLAVVDPQPADPYQ